MGNTLPDNASANSSLPIDHELLKVFNHLVNREEEAAFNEIEQIFMDRGLVARMIISAQIQILGRLFGRHSLSNALQFSSEVALEHVFHGEEVQRKRLVAERKTRRLASIRPARAVKDDLDETSATAYQDVYRWRDLLETWDAHLAQKSVPRRLRAFIETNSKLFVAKAAADKCDYNTTVKAVHLSLLDEINSAFFTRLNDRFAETTLREKVVRFYDSDFIDHIQWTCRKILSSQFALQVQELHPSTRKRYFDETPDAANAEKIGASTTIDVLRALKTFRFNMMHDSSILTSSSTDSASLLRNLVGNLKYCRERSFENKRECSTLIEDIMVTILLRILMTGGVLDEDLFDNVYVSLSGSASGSAALRGRGESVRMANLLRPKTDEARDFYIKLLREGSDNSLGGPSSAPVNKMPVDHSDSIRVGRNETMARKRVVVASTVGRGSTGKFLDSPKDLDSYLDAYFAAAELLLTKYLWYNAFELMITLQGMCASQEEFPYSEISEGPPGEELLSYNRRKMKFIFAQLSYNTGFLPADLADEAYLLLTEGRLPFACAVACLNHLGVSQTRDLKSLRYTGGSDKRLFIDEFDRISSTWSADDQCSVWRHAMDTDSRREPEDPSKLNAVLDWTWYRVNHGWSDVQMEAYDRYAGSTGFFIAKSQLLDFMQWLRSLFLPSMNEKGVGTMAGSATFKSGHGLSEEKSSILIDLDFFHHVVTLLGISESKKSSHILWNVVALQIVAHEAEKDWWLDRIEMPSTQQSRDEQPPNGLLRPADDADDDIHFDLLGVRENHSASETPRQKTPTDTTTPESKRIEWMHGEVPSLLPLGPATRALLRVLLLPTNSAGVVVSLDDTFESIESYSGVLPPLGLVKFFQLSRISLPTEGFWNIWGRLPKSMLEIGDIIPIHLKRMMAKSPEFQRNLAAARRKILPTKSRRKSLLSRKTDTQIESTEDLTTTLEKLRIYFTSASAQAHLDPTFGSFVSITDLRFELPKILMTGLWPEAIQAIFELNLNRVVRGTELRAAFMKWIEIPHCPLLTPTGLFRFEYLSFLLFEQMSVRALPIASLKNALREMKMHLDPLHIQMWLVVKEAQGQRRTLPRGIGGHLLCEKHMAMCPWIASSTMARSRVYDSQEPLAIDLIDGDDDFGTTGEDSGVETLACVSFPQFQLGLKALVTEGLYDVVVEATGLTVVAEIKILFIYVALLCAILGFFGAAASAFSGLNSITSTVLQSALAIAGAIGLQSGLSRNKDDLEKEVIKQMSALFDAPLSKIIQNAPTSHAQLLSDAPKASKQTPPVVIHLEETRLSVFSSTRVKRFASGRTLILS